MKLDWIHVLVQADTSLRTLIVYRILMNVKLHVHITID